MRRTSKKYLVLVALLILVFVTACGNSKNETKKEEETPKEESLNEKDTSKEDETKMEEETSQETETSKEDDKEAEKNEFNYANVAPKDLPAEWESAQFYYGNKKYELLGKKVSDIPKEIPLKNPSQVKEVKSGDSIDLGLEVEREQRDFSQFVLRVMNPTNKDIPVEDCVIVGIGVSNAYLITNMPNYDNNPEAINSFILPKGLAPYDKAEKIEQLYGKPTKKKVIENTKDIEYIYYSKDGSKKFIVSSFDGYVSSFRMHINLKADYLVELEKSKTKDEFSKDLQKDSFININGNKIKLNTKFKEVYDKFSFESIIDTEQNKDDPKVKEIKAKSEITLMAKIKGFNGDLNFRLVNTTDKPIKAVDATLVGVNAIYKKPSDSKVDPTAEILPSMIYRGDKVNLIVVGPYGIRLGEARDEGFKKLPDKALEKELLDDGGGYFTDKKDNMFMKVMVYPKAEGSVIDEILITMENIGI